MARREELGRGLRSLRKQRGLTEVELAQQSGVSQSTISRLELGRVSRESPEAVERLLKALRASPKVRREVLAELDSVLTEVETWRTLARAGMRRRQEQIRKLEEASRTIRLFQPAMIPGQLQTPDYATAVFSEVARTTGQTDVAEAVAARMQRQAILGDESKRFTFLMTEAAFRNRLGAAGMMAAQVDAVRSAAARPNVVVEIIPAAAELPMAPLHGFVLFDDSMAYVETFADEIMLHDPRDVGLYARAFETLRRAAVRGLHADRLLAAIAKDLRRV